MKILRNVSFVNPSELHLSRPPSDIYFIWPLSSLRLTLQSLVHHTFPAGFWTTFPVPALAFLYGHTVQH